MFSVPGIMFACGAGLGVVFATTCMTLAAIYDHYVAEKKAVAARKAEKIRYFREEKPRLPEPKILYITHKSS